MSAHSETIHVFNRTVPVPEEDYSASPYLEEKAHWKVMSRVQRSIIGCLGLAAVALSATVFQLATRPRDIVVVNVDETGRAFVAPRESIIFNPSEQVFKFFLTQFTEDHFSMVRSKIVEANKRKVKFLSGELASAVINADDQDKTVAKFLASSEEDVEVYVTKVSIEDMRTAPWKATVDYEKVYRYRNDLHELKRTKHTAHYQFNMIDPSRLRQDVIKVNPLGFVITYFRTDEAY